MELEKRIKRLETAAPESAERLALDPEDEMLVERILARLTDADVRAIEAGGRTEHFEEIVREVVREWFDDGYPPPPLNTNPGGADMAPDAPPNA